MHGLHLSEKNNLSFKQICDKKAIVIQYDREETDIEVSNNKLVKRSNDDPDGYWPWKGPNVKMPDYRSTDTVGDTELISTFLEKNKISDVTWIAESVDSTDSTEDVIISSHGCNVPILTSRGYQCLPPHLYVPEYIWTAPQQQGLSM